MSIENNNEYNSGLIKTILNDLGRFIKELFSGRFIKTFKQELKNLKDFYIDENRKKRLEEMGRIRRTVYLTPWLLKSLFFKLSSFRRVLLVLSIILFFTITKNENSSINPIIVFTIFLLFILMLELKDKLLARKELEAGRSVQYALMPEKTPKVRGWDIWLFSRPANDVGGDMVDFIKISNSQNGLALADVAGKGLAAALFMAKLQATLRALVPDVESLDKLGTKINRIFHRDGLANNFATMLYFEINSDSKEVKFLNAGHYPPIMLKEKTIRELSKGDPALGIIPDTIYSQQKIVMEREDIIIGYSDGIIEARNESGIFFGEQRLLDLLTSLSGLSANHIGERLLHEVDSFAGYAEQNDDISIIIFKRTV